uniref:Uncharacterized protein n=1 Tax=Glossina brevipalpis TaxID=37001 RepID=A0A1A9WWS5_9MUSC
MTYEAYDILSTLEDVYRHNLNHNPLLIALSKSSFDPPIRGSISTVRCFRVSSSSSCKLLPKRRSIRRGFSVGFPVVVVDNPLAIGGLSGGL